MTIRTKEPEVPDKFPPARLFLDDIEEIVRILVDATENRKEQSRPSAAFLATLADPDNPNENPRLFDQPARTSVTLTIKDQVCDEVQELPKIAKKTTDLQIDVVTNRWTVAVASLAFRKEDGSDLRCFRLTDEERLNLFHKLTPIFKRRNLRLRTLAWSHYWFFVGALFTSCLLALGVLAILTSKHPIHPTRAIVVALPLVSIIVTLWPILSRHSIVVLRHSSEPSPLGQELLQKAPLAAISSVITFLLTLLGFYLKHKYWP